MNANKRTVAVILDAGTGIDPAREILGKPLFLYAREIATTAGCEVMTPRRESWFTRLSDALRAIKQERPGTTVLLLPADAPLLSAASLRKTIALHKKKNADCTVIAGGEHAGDCELFSAEVALFRASALSGRTVRSSPSPETLVRRIAEAGGKVVAAHPRSPEELLRVDDLRTLAVASNAIRCRILQEKMAAGVVVIDPSTTHIEQDVRIGRGTTIFPFTFIHRGVTIGRHCEIGPFSHLRAGSVLDNHAEIGNFVEVKNSRVGPRSKAKHLSYLGDATLGRGVNIGAGTITANYDGKRKHKTLIDDGASTGSNTVLVAPVRMGRKARTGAGAVVVSGNDVRDGDTVVGVPARSLGFARNPSRSDKR
ncbi:MAG: hypothetical protein A2Z34_03025 [Planctomycetes bacterium RBG_16_59_8]|nr:MAG: hypothetical protein A2Z34_03025 [Planctomycetes bacterium RBG_16_59_8]